MRWFFFFAIAMFPCIAISQIAAGPMLGYCEMKEALVWIQTEGSQNISIQYSVRGNNWITSEEITTGSPSAYTHKFILSPLEPGFSYTYRFLIDGKPLTDEYTLTTQKLWQHREDPPEFTFFTGSCAFINEPQYDRPGKGYGKSKDIFLKMAEMNPDMMLWLGDNVYLREPDWTSWSGFMHRYSHTRQQPELQPLLAACPHFAIWDDHDFGPNDSNRSWIHKDWSQDAFELFWGNPSYGLEPGKGITTQFQFNDADFFLLDNRYFRTDERIDQDVQCIWCEDQVDWLIEALKFSKANFKFVATGGQFLSNFAKYENHALYQKERKEVINRIKKAGITGVIFLTGDRHHTELSEMSLGKGNKIYDLTASPLTSTAYDHAKEPNKYRVPGTIVGTQNFAAITLKGSWEERICIIKVYDVEGELLWEKQIERW